MRINSPKNILLNLILLIILICPSQIFPLNPHKKFSQYVLDSWLSDDGIPQNTVHAVIQTKEGYIWIGTEEGLARFDGNKFTVFDSKNHPDLKFDEINSLYQDYKGTLWIGTAGGGIITFKSNKFVSISKKDSIPISLIWKVTGDSHGKIWMLTNKGVYFYNKEKFTKFKLNKKFASSSLTSLTVGAEGGVWIGNSHGEIVRFNNGKYYNYFLAYNKKHPVINDLHSDHKGNMWIATSAGIFRIDRKNIIHRPDNYKERNLIASAIYVDREGTRWFATEQGLARMVNDKIDWLTVKDGLTDNEIYSLTEDSNGSLWIGTGRGGLNCLKEGICYTITKKDGLVGKEIFPVYQSSNKDIWVGSPNGLTLIEGDKFINYTDKNGLPYNYVSSICQDRNGMMWFGTDGDGLFSFSKGKFISYFKKNQVPGSTIFSICRGKGKDMWIGSFYSGLYHYHNNKFTHYSTENGLPTNYVLSLAVDKRGTLWIGTLDAGLVKFKKGTFTAFNTRNGLSNNAVYSLYPDSDSTLWIGTGSGGLDRFKNGKFEVFDYANGLFDNKIYVIIDDGFGNLWMSSNKGIFRVSKKELNDYASGKIKAYNCFAYGVEDGMKNSECNGGVQYAGIRASSGKLLFPTEEGLVVVNPYYIKKHKDPPPVYIENLKINNSSIKLNKNIKVPVGEGKIEIYFTAIDFLVPNRVKFKYKLVGFDKNWVDAGNRRSAFYTNIPYGDYTFKIMACSDEGVWNKKGASVSFYLRPKFYQTEWFYLLCVLSLIGLLYLGYRIRLKRLIKQKYELENKVTERTASLLNEKLKLERTELKFRSVTESATDAIVGLNSEAKIILWNKSAEKLFLYSQLDSLGKSFDILFSDQKVKGDKDSIVNFLLGNKGKTIELEGINKHFQKFPLEVSFSDWKSENEIFYTAIIRDITERKQTEEALKNSEIMLKKSNINKDKFFSIISHDLRSPFNSLLGFSEYLSNEVEELTDDEKKSISKNIFKSASGILRLLDNLLLWSRFQTNVLEFIPEVFDINILIKQVLEIYNANILHKDQNIELFLEDDLKVFADRNMIETVIRNLLSNAIKFTLKSGSIKIYSIKNSSYAEIIIEDTGAGIGEENIPKLFKIEESYSTKGTEKEKGSGLGLILCNEFVSKNKGKIWLESEIGKGSKFHFTLPLHYKKDLILS